MPKDPSRTDKAANAVPPESLAWYDQLVATIPQVERNGATVPYTSWNGHMFSYLAPALALRLPPQARTEFLERYQTALREAYGVVQKEYVVVPAMLLPQTQDLQPYFQISFDYVNSLRPKPHKPGKPKSGSSNPERHVQPGRVMSSTTVSSSQCFERQVPAMRRQGGTDAA